MFGGGLAQPLAETIPPRPINYYGQTKLEGEQKILAQHQSVYIIRTSWLYSAVGSNLLTSILAQANQGKAIRYVYDQISSPTYAGDLAQAIWEMICKLNQAPSQYSPGIYHYANEGIASRYDFAWAIINYASIACQIIPGLSRDFSGLAQRLVYSVLSKEKVKHTFGLSIPHWQESLRHCIGKLATTIVNVK